MCSCPPGHSGNPLTYCTRSECLDHSECRSDQACRNGNCVNPCAGTCGSNANCEVRPYNFTSIYGIIESFLFKDQKSCASLQLSSKIYW